MDFILIFVSVADQTNIFVILKLSNFKMRKLFSGIFIIILPCLIFSLASCTPGSCFEETESYLKASFYNNETKKLVAPDSVTLYGLNNDSIIYDKSAKVQPALIPLNASKDTCTFVIVINGVTDTVEFTYNSYPHLISKECGYTFYHQLDTVLTKNHAIKDVYISNKTITNLNVENIRIFY
jgi:hypothetical protein